MKTNKRHVFVRVPPDPARPVQKLTIQYDPRDPANAAIERLLVTALWGSTNKLCLQAMRIGVAVMLGEQLSAQKIEQAPDQKTGETPSSMGVQKTVPEAKAGLADAGKDGVATATPAYKSEASEPPDQEPRHSVIGTDPLRRRKTGIEIIRNRSGD